MQTEKTVLREGPPAEEDKDKKPPAVEAAPAEGAVSAEPEKKEEDKAVAGEPMAVKADHPLDPVLATFRAAFDQAMSLQGTPDDKLVALQDGFNTLGMSLQAIVRGVEKPEQPAGPPVEEVIARAVAAAIQPLQQEIAAFRAERNSGVRALQPVTPTVPVRRAVRLNALPLGSSPVLHSAQRVAPTGDGKTPKLNAIVRRSVIPGG